MTDPIRRQLADDLHAVSFGEGVACDYHARPKTIAIEKPILFEAIKLIDHPQLQVDEWPDNWQLDAARCSDHAVDELEEPTRGFEEALVEITVQTSNISDTWQRSTAVRL